MPFRVSPLQKEPTAEGNAVKIYLEWDPSKDERGTVIRNKARLVAQGFEDLEFLDRVYKVEKHYMDCTKLLKLEVKTVSTSMETHKPLLKDEDGEEVDVYMYRSMIGSLMYLTSSRPDIMFA
nr:hypothetical protein [Tanacetum cinerariifolium]